MCMYEEGRGERERQTDRQIDRQRERDRERQRDRESNTMQQESRCGIRNSERKGNESLYSSAS